MEQQVLNALNGFEAVWERVMHSQGAGTPPPAPVDGTAAELETLLQNLNGLWERYRELARRTAGEAQKRFLKLAEETRESVRSLQTAYFLHTGEVFHPCAPDCPVPGVLSGMRRACETEQELAERLKKAGFSADAALGHVRQLREMIAQLLRA